jgi:acyl carrier protein
MTIEDRVRKVVSVHGRLTADAFQVDTEADLYRAGLTSHASVNLMLALEDEFDVEFPERLLRRQTFESIALISAALVELSAEED